MDEKDLDFVICTLKGERTMYEPDWHSVIGFLESNRVSGLFYNILKKGDIHMPYKAEKILKDIFEKQRRCVCFMREQLVKIVDKLEQGNVPYMLLKGSVLSNISDEAYIYDDGERASNDIDLLVKPDGITAVSKVLRRLGFVQGVYDAETNSIKKFSRAEIVKRRMSRGELAPFVKKTKNKEFPFIEVDVNFSLGNTPAERVDLLNAMIEDSKLYAQKIKMSVPKKELFFLHLIMHQYKESCLTFMVERGKDLDLYKLTDIYYIWKNNVLDLSYIVELVQKYGLQQEIGVVLNQVGEIFADSEVINFAKRFNFETPKVIDYANKKTYKWEASNRERIRSMISKRYLKEL